MPMTVRKKKVQKFVIPGSQLPEGFAEGDCWFEIITPKRSTGEQAASKAIKEVHKQPISARALKEHRKKDHEDVERTFQIDVLQSSVWNACLKDFIFPGEDGKTLDSTKLDPGERREVLDFLDDDLESYVNVAIDVMSGTTISQDKLDELLTLGVTMGHLHIEQDSVKGADDVEDPTGSGESA